MKKLLSALVALALCSGLAMATVPDPTNCQVLPCDNLGPANVGGVVLCPATPSPIPASQVTVTVKNAANNVIPNASIVVTFGNTILNPTCTPSAPWNGTTNGSGVWTKVFSGGGCNNAAQACVITANGQIIRSYTNVKSPDYDGAGANLQVAGNDFSNFLAAYQTSAPGCHDYDNNNATGLGDFVIFAGAVSPGHVCP